jgi:hypothetical protein
VAETGRVVLATLGHEQWTGQEENWLGSDVPMWWSHADSATYRAWIEGCGLEVTHVGFVAEGTREVMHSSGPGNRRSEVRLRRLRGSLSEERSHEHRSANVYLMSDVP